MITYKYAFFVNANYILFKLKLLETNIIFSNIFILSKKYIKSSFHCGSKIEITRPMHFIVLLQCISVTWVKVHLATRWVFYGKRSFIIICEGLVSGFVLGLVGSPVVSLVSGIPTRPKHKPKNNPTPTYKVPTLCFIASWTITVICCDVIDF